jgi:hypothetical protein
MLYLWGPGLDAEVDYRRAELGKTASVWSQLRRRVRQAGRSRPRPW